MRNSKANGLHIMDEERQSCISYFAFRMLHNTIRHNPAGVRDKAGTGAGASHAQPEVRVRGQS